MSGREFFCVERLRCDCFVTEQKITLPELDDTDLQAVQVYLLNKKRTNALATCRLYQDPQYGWMVGRVAVSQKYRREHLGSQMMKQVANYLRGLGAKRLTCHAQIQARPFYRYLGYQSQGPVFLEGGVKHILMYRNL